MLNDTSSHLSTGLYIKLIWLPAKVIMAIIS